VTGMFEYVDISHLILPHYVTDPGDAKVVAKEVWFAAPAEPPVVRE